MFAELSGSQWHWYSAPLSLFVMVWIFYLMNWLIERSFDCFRTIGLTYVGPILLLCLMAGFATAGWHYGYYNTPQNKPYTTYEGGLWHNSAGKSHYTSPTFTDHDENTERRAVACMCAALGAILVLSLVAPLADAASFVKSRKDELKVMSEKGKK